MNFSNLTFNITDYNRHGSKVVNVKELCAGIVGQELMILIASLLFFNLVCVLFWHRIRLVKIPLGTWKTIDLAYLIPVVNFIGLLFIFQYAYNLW